jgi:hypothetical protein
MLGLALLVVNSNYMDQKNGAMAPSTRTRQMARWFTRRDSSSALALRSL